jgi:hypothetical protein
MAAGVVTEATQDGEDVRVTVTVDEGLAGSVDYTARVRIADLRSLATNAARKTALLNAVIAVRTDQLAKEAQIDAFLGSLIGAAVTV